MIDAYVAGYVVPAAITEGEDAESWPAFLFTEVDGIRVRRYCAAWRACLNPAAGAVPARFRR